jgi:hypothetical protein
LQFDFSLTSFSDNTDVFIDADNTYIRYHGTTTDVPAMRVAFIYDNGKETNVMNPTGKSRTVQAVDVVNFGTGECKQTATQISQPFSYYTATQGNQLFTLDNGETQNMSVVIWLEGTDSACVNSIIAKSLDINIKFSTTWDNMDEITFSDVSTDSWISDLLQGNGQLQLVYKDATNVETTYDMVQSTASDTKFTCKIPKTIDSGISFKLTTSDGKEYVWDTEPNGTSSTYRGQNVTYSAKGTTDAPVGYWKSSDTDNEIPVDTLPVDEEW